MESLTHHMKAFGTLCYLVNPYHTLFENEDNNSLPKQQNTTVQTVPYFLSLLLIEHTVLLLKGKRGIRINDGIMSASHGLIVMVKDVILKTSLMNVYIYIYKTYRVSDLPWDSLGTWVLASLIADFAYYWGHRASHELNILWASHQTHHSSEDFNITTALRQSAMQAFGTMPMYLPAALLIPPSHILAHMQFNHLYQFWIHTEAIRTIGPLEHVLNTPQHHRVHHGSNLYCLDKNYGGVFIIWDRLFGTFEWERPEEEMVYGLVYHPRYFNPIKHQVYYYGKVLEKARNMESWSDKASALFKGPGWSPGAPRLGDRSTIPDVQNRSRYDPKVSVWVNAYVILHFAFLLLLFDELNSRNMEMTQVMVLTIAFFILWSLSSLGMIFDKSKMAWISESMRCLLVLLCSNSFSEVSKEFQISSLMLNAVFATSLLTSLVFYVIVTKHVSKFE